MAVITVYDFLVVMYCPLRVSLYSQSCRKRTFRSVRCPLSGRSRSFTTVSFYRVLDLPREKRETERERERERERQRDRERQRERQRYIQILRERMTGISSTFQTRVDMCMCVRVGKKQLDSQKVGVQHFSFVLEMLLRMRQVRKRKRDRAREGVGGCGGLWMYTVLACNRRTYFSV